MQWQIVSCTSNSDQITVFVRQESPITASLMLEIDTQ